MGKKFTGTTVKEIRDWLERPAARVGERGGRFNMLRGAAARLTTPLLPDDYLHLANPLWSARELRGRIVAARSETADSVTLVIKPGWGFDFTYQPGQYIGIGVLLDGRWLWRSYSLTSPPDWSDSRHGKKVISIAVKAMPEGLLSTHLVKGVPVGTVVRLAAPKGSFVLPDPPPEKILFLTAGSGITPVMSMLRTMNRRGTLPDVVHVHSARSAADVMFASELTQLARQHPNFTFTPYLTEDKGKLPLSDIGRLVPDWQQRHTWACGPLPILEAAEQHWRTAQLADRLHVERFELERGAVGEGGIVEFTRSGRSLEVDGATTLLEAGEKAGIGLPFGCRMGICQTCVLTLQSGHTRDLRNGVEHQAGEKVQTCVNAAAGDCAFDM